MNALTAHAPRIAMHLLMAGMTGILLIAAPALAAEGGLQNPSVFGSIPEFIAGVLRAIVMIAIPIITLFFVYAGFKFIMARGNEGKLQEARMNFLYAVLGSLLILGAWVLATLIAGTVTQLVGK